MTRRILNLAPHRQADKRGLLRPLGAQRNLTGEVVERIASEIRSGQLLPGARLPTEQSMMAAMGVSRTVVREAVAALRAEGLVTTRQGSGAFVARDRTRMPFRIDPDGLSSIADVLEVMELRLAVEVEAAALAAERISAARVGPIARSLRALEAAIERGEAAIDQDFDFHRAIARASGNSRFSELLEFLGRYIIPRQSIRLALSTPGEQKQYLVRIQNEHTRIFESIRHGNPSNARKAMRAHLRRSLRRYHRLAERELATR